MVQFHALGDVNPLVSVLVANTRYDSVAQFPFEALGLVALVILFAMAATSHDFWLANLHRAGVEVRCTCWSTSPTRCS